MIMPDVHLEAGAELPVSAPRNHFRIDPLSGRHLLIAGGIGVTPLLPMARELKRQGAAFAFHYCARNRVSAPLLEELEALCGAELKTWMTGDAERFDPVSVLAEETGAELYVCGPVRLTDAVEQAALSLHWPT